MKKIPTVEELLSEEIKKFSAPLSSDGLILLVINVANQHAINHVQVALKEALESIPCLGSSTDIATFEEVIDAVLTSYSLSNIK